MPEIELVIHEIRAWNLAKFRKTLEDTKREQPWRYLEICEFFGVKSDDVKPQNRTY